MEVLRIMNLIYDRNFQLTNCFVCIKQTSENGSLEAAIQMCSLKYMFLWKKLKGRMNP